MIKNDKKVAFRKHLERLTLSDVRGRSGWRAAVSCHGLARFPVGAEKAACCVVPAPAFEARRSIEETFCLPSELRASCTQACYLSGHDQSARFETSVAILHSSEPLAGAQVVPGQRPAQAMSLGLQCQCPAPESCESPFFNNLWCPVTVFPSGVTSGDVLEPGVNWPHMPAPP